VSTPKPSLLQVLTSPRVWLLVALGFSSGLPILLIGGTLSAWMKNEGVDLKTIGLFALVGSPYSLKFVWAPLMDRYALPFLGRRRGWMLLTQLGLAAAIAAMGLVPPGRSPLLVAALAFVVSFLSASQDVVADAWRTDTLSETERGFGTATFVTGYRLGMLAAGALALSLSELIGWQHTYFSMAALMGVGVLATLLAPEPQGIRPPRTLADAVRLPFLDYFRRNGALLALLFIVLYKLGDSIAGNMTVPFFIEIGFGNTEIGVISKGMGMFATILGGLVGGGLMVRLGMRRSLFVFGALQALTNVSFLALALVGRSSWLLATAIGLDNFCGGLAATALVAFQMSLCDSRFSATQYALLSSLAASGTRIFAASAGFLATWLGWAGFFSLSIVLAVPALALLTVLPQDVATPAPEPAPEPQPATGPTAL
jgi:MFS transporter, PAT family, beta-lactamase induction signal transducer AmpG